MAEVVDNPDADRFEITVDGAVAGVLAYQKRGDLIALVHTEVEPAYEGQGLASQLARGALDAARAGGLQVLPFCPYVRGWIEKHPEYVDLVPAGQRTPFGLPNA